MDYFEEIEKRHSEQYETDPEYRAKFDAESARRVAELERLENQQSRARNEAGRYTLEEAARFIADNSNSIYSSILDKLKKSANTGKLPFYAPNSNEAFKKRTAVLGWCEEVFFDDLNEWLKNNEPRLDCLFPKIGIAKDGTGRKKTTTKKNSNDDEEGRPTERRTYLRAIWEELKRPARNNKIWVELRRRANSNGPIKQVIGCDEFTFEYKDGHSEQLLRKTFQNDMTEIRKQK